jgi:hypothetical protein
VPAGPPPGGPWRYEPTEWTRRLQVILLALLAFGVLFAIVVLPTVLLPLMQQSMDRSLALQAANSNVDTEQLRFMRTTLYTSLGIGAVGGVVLVVIVAVGIVKLWRWVYWYLVVSFLFAVLGIPQNVANAVGSGPVSILAWWLLASIPLALAEAALGVWMIVLYRRYGTWARRRVPA